MPWVFPPVAIGIRRGGCSYMGYVFGLRWLIGMQAAERQSLVTLGEKYHYKL